MPRSLTPLLALVLAACAVNPATGRRELSFIGEGREIQMGREADGSVSASMGLVDDAELQAYVDGLGQRLAAASERPELPWSFKVVDDPIVNAFALPGGFIYVTRGILVHFENEAELVGVLGHEIGHVTARHSVSQMSNQIALQAALGVGMVLSERVRSVGDLLGAGTQLLSLRFSRSDESEADELGVRYMNRIAYNPEALIGVFQMLASVSGSSSDSRTPEWALTHPYPENREANISALLTAAGEQPTGTENRDRFLDRLNGMVYGINPREGFFEGSLFAHPEMEFQVTFPDGWAGVNQRTQVVGISPDEDGAVVLTLAEGTDPRAVVEAFVQQDGVDGGTIRESSDGGLDRARARFTAETDDGEVRGEIAVVAMDGQLYSLLGFSEAGAWSRNRDGIASTLSSFSRLTDAALLGRQPLRVEVVSLRSALSVRAFHEQSRSPVTVEELARINRVDPDQVLPQGRRIKRVVR